MIVALSLVIWMLAAAAVTAVVLRLLRGRVRASAVVRGALILTAVAGGVVLVTGLAPPPRVKMVLIVDDASGRVASVSDPTARQSAAVAANAALTQLREYGLSEYELIAITGESRSAPQPPKWRSVDSELDMTTAAVAPNPEAALQMAADRFAGPAWQRILHGDLFYPNRVVVVATFPKEWGKYQFDNVSKLVTQFRDAGVVVDLWENSDAGDASALEIIPSAAILPARRQLSAFSDELKIRFRLKSPRLSEQNSLPVQWRLQGTIRGLTSDKTVPVMVPDGGTPDPSSPYEYTGETQTLDDGSVELTCRLNQMIPKSASLEEGQNLVSARLTVTNTNKEIAITAEREIYLPALFRELVVVAGNDSVGLGPAQNLEKIHDAWQSLSLAGSGRLPWHVIFEEVCDEATFKAKLAANRPPFLLALHRVSRDTLVDVWNSKWIENGTHLILSGFPPLSPNDLKSDLETLPAIPKLSPYAADETKPANNTDARVPWVLHRRPRLLFVRDPSRLWSAEHAPSPAPIVERGGSPKLTAGTTVQDVIIEKVRERLGMKGGSSLVGAAAWLDVIDFDPPRDPTLNDRSSLWELSDLSRRLRLSPALAKVEASIDGRIPELEGFAPRPYELRTNDVVVVFTANAPQRTDGAAVPSALARAIARGAVVRLVVLETPFDKGLEQLPGDVKCESVSDLVEKLRKEAAKFAKDEKLPFFEADVQARAAVTEKDLTELRVWVDSQPSRLPPQERANQVAEAIANSVRPRLLLPTTSHFRVHRFGRVIDERFGPTVKEAEPPPPAAPPGAWAGPTHQQLIDAQDETWRAPMYASVAESADREPPGLPVTAIRAGVVGNGTVAIVGYSLFEDTNAQLSTLAKDLGLTEVPAEWRVYAPGKVRRIAADRWGPQRIFDMTEFHSRLTNVPDARHPRIVSAERIGAIGQVRVLVTRQSPAEPAKLMASGSKSEGEAKTIDGRLVHLRENGQVLEYEFDPPEADGAGWWRLKGGLEADRLYLVGKRAADTNLPAIAATSALAGFTGGVAVNQAKLLPDPPARVRVWGVAAVVVSLAMLWFWQVLVRASSAIRTGRAARLESKRAADEPSSTGTVAGAGGALAPPVTYLAAGPFAGYRPFEPGDRLAAAVSEDLVMLAGLGLPIIPRLVRRVDEQSTSVVLIIAVGRSARIPAPLFTSPPPKVLGLAVAAELLAEMVWLRNGHVTVRLVGATGDCALGPLRAEPAPGALRRFVLSAAERSPAPILIPADLKPVEPGTRVVYLSDMLTEPREDFVKWAYELEDNGGQFGMMVVYSPTEFSLTGPGLITAPMIYSDRTELTADDVAAEYRELWQQWGATLQGTHGGTIVVSAAATKLQMLAEVQASRIVSVICGVSA